MHPSEQRFDMYGFLWIVGLNGIQLTFQEGYDLYNSYYEAHLRSYPCAATSPNS